MLTTTQLDKFSELYEGKIKPAIIQEKEQFLAFSDVAYEFLQKKEVTEFLQQRSSTNDNSKERQLK